MIWTKAKVVVSIGAVLIGIGTIVRLIQRPAAQEAKRQQANVALAAHRISEANVGLPDPQVQIKSLIFAAMIQKQVPAANHWCDTLNAGKKLWPVTPTNTWFALNSQMAGQVYRQGMAGDTVVFFETLKPGWNQIGGPELLARKAAGVAVALMDGRALMVGVEEAAKLRWTP